MKLFEIFGEIKLDDKNANKALGDTDDKAKGVASRLGGMAKTAGKWGAGIAAGVGAGASALGLMAKKAADAGDEIHKGSQRMGVSTDAYQEMEYWASQNGMSMGDMEKVAGRLNQRLGSAAAGNEKYSSALEKLGVNMDDVRAGTVSTEDAFAKSIQSLSQITNEQEKAALASELFGTKLSREMLPALNDSSLSFEDAQLKAAELGIVLSEDSINASATFSDTMDDIKRSMGAVATNIGMEFMPVIQTMLDWVIENMPTIQKVVKKVFDVIADVVKVAIDIFTDFLLPIFKEVHEWVSENWETISDIFKGVFTAIEAVWNNVLSPVLGFLWDALKVIVEWVSENWGTISGAFSTVFGAIKTVWDNVLSPVLKTWWDILKEIVTFVTDVFSGVTEIFETAFEGIGKAVEKVTGFFTAFIDKIKEAWNWLTKWNKKKPEDKDISTGDEDTDGSHRTGKAYIPYDGYVAELHKGERVLTAEENQSYSRGSGINQTVNIYAPKQLSPSEIARENKKALQRLALQV